MDGSGNGSLGKKMHAVLRISHAGGGGRWEGKFSVWGDCEEGRMEMPSELGYVKLARDQACVSKMIQI